jgi:hyperosmotically inducible periplasmic protein
MNRIASLALVAAASIVALQTAGCAVARDQQSVGSFIDDSTLTTRVKAKFAEDPTVSALAISVETLKGQVQLSGFAKSASEKSMAEQLARNTSGVQSVKNDIVVRP